MELLALSVLRELTVNNPHNQSTSKKLFILDTNVLMHDPTCIFRFQEHDIFIPMVVLEELDRAKKGHSDIARNVRQISRFFNDLIEKEAPLSLTEGICIHPLNNGNNIPHCATGKLFFQTEAFNLSSDQPIIGTINDNQILLTADALQKKYSDRQCIIVSKDINLRIKGHILGLTVEDYFSDQVLDDVDLLYTGVQTLEDDFWDKSVQNLQSWTEGPRTFYRFNTALAANWQVCQALFMSDGIDYIIREIEGDSVLIERLKDYQHHAIWGINARNREQNFAFNLLLDPELDFVTILGTAGTGKTLLALAAGLQLTLDKSLFTEIIMTRATIAVSEDIGFLPGTEEEKMTPWMGALLDNLEVLNETHGDNSWGKNATNDLLSHRIKIRSLNFMRGRTFQNRFLIIDEAQNLTAKQMKTLITRAGPGTKVVCLGNLGQIDTPFLTETSSGLTYVVDHFKSWPHSGHVTLQRGERSRLARYASDVL